GLKRRNVEQAEIARRVHAAAAKLGLTEFLQRKPHALSGGQRQRVALGRAIVRDPKVFLFDEPLSNLDAALRVSTRNELIRQQDSGTPPIHAPRDRAGPMPRAHPICNITRDRVVQTGDPPEVYRKPANPFVAPFLGTPPMNLLPGRIDIDDGRVVATLAGAAV